MATVCSEHARGLGGLAVGISIALWNYIGWDNPSTVQGEVKDPSRTIRARSLSRCRLSRSATSFHCSQRSVQAIGLRGLKVAGRRSLPQRLEVPADGLQSGSPSAE
jgi:Amino acid transporters